MFNRISYEEWTSVIPILGFLLTFSAFAIIVYKTLRMKKSQQEEMANLPFEDSEKE